MDGLEKYKKSWENQPEEKNKISQVEIYKMAHSGSSSIVKWIFIIGILELLFWSALNLSIPESYLEVYQKFDLVNFIKLTTYLHYVVILLFLALFYKNYVAISIIDNTKTLMNKILKTRKTVKYYVYYNLIGFIVITIIINSILFSHPEKLIFLMKTDVVSSDISSLITITLILQIVVLLFIFLILWLFYKITYGTLLKKLNRNYKELAKLDELN